MACLLPRQKGRVPMPSAFFPTATKEENSQKSTELNSRESGGVIVQPFNFPPTKQIWWDRKPQGSSEILHVTSKRNLRLHLNEKTLRLGVKHMNKSMSPYDCFFIGSIFIDSCEDAVEINIDRFDPGREFIDKQGGSKKKFPTTVVPGDQVIPLTLVKGLIGAEQSVIHSKQEFLKTFEVLHSRFASQEPLSLSNLLSIKACCYAHTEDDDMIINIQFGVVTMVTSILATPVHPVPIIPTALARNLMGPLRLSDVQGVPKCGFLTMDHTRKLLLLLESDPKAYSLPLIGVWVSGPFTVHHPYIWASCVRFLHSTEIKERALVSPNTFLLVHYSPAQTNPIFWECMMQDQLQTSLFDLYSCYENIHLDQVSAASYPEPLCFDLLPAGGNMYKEVFEQAAKTWTITRTAPTSHKGSDIEEKQKHEPITTLSLEPRPSPSPYPQGQKNKLLVPTVPEVSLSLSFEESSIVHDKTDSNFVPPRVVRKILPDHVEIPGTLQEQENRLPLGLVQRNVGKQALMVDSSQQSPQRRPLNPITAQHTNNSFPGPKITQQKYEPQLQEYRSKHTCHNKAPIKGVNRQDNAKKDSQMNVIHGDKRALAPSSERKPTERSLSTKGSTQDILTPANSKEQRSELEMPSNASPEQETLDSCVSKECRKEDDSFKDQSEFCDSGVGDSSKDVSFPEEEQQQLRMEAQPQQNDPNMKQLQQQLKDLQQQINLLLLQQSLAQCAPNGIPTPPPTPVTDTSNLSPLPRFEPMAVVTKTPSPPATAAKNKVTIATSTGTSLLMGSPAGPDKVSVGTSPIKRTSENKPRSQRTSPNISVSSHISMERPSPDQTINADELQLDRLNNTNQTLASSIHAVDICEFSPESTSKQPYNSSPVLGESVSMFMDQATDTPPHQPQPEHYQYDSLLLRNEKLFYDNLLDRVNKLLSKRFEGEKSSDSSRVSTDDKVNGSAVCLPSKEEVLKATVQELDRLKGSSIDHKETISPNTKSDNPSNQVITGLPHLNYISMSMEDSMIESSVLGRHSLDAAYLSTSQLQEYRHVMDDYCSTRGRGQTRVNSIRDSSEVNCTWNNLSMATQDYLKRYNFSGNKEKVEEDQLDFRDLSRKSVSSIHCTAPPSTPEPLTNSTDRILDIKRLKNLPKLL